MDIEKLTYLLRSYNLERVEEFVVDEAKPCIWVTSTRAEGTGVKVGASKMGGTPDFPRNFVWPKKDGLPLAFIGQISLFEATKFDREKRLPIRGYLWFFYDALQQPWGDFEDSGSWSVLYADCLPIDLYPVEFPPNLDAEVRFKTCQLHFAEGISLPSVYSEQVAELELDDDESEAYESIRGDLGNKLYEGGCHQLLGHPNPCQEDVLLATEHFSRTFDLEEFQKDPTANFYSTRQWTLLLQISSDENLGWMWGDAGSIYFSIRPKDFEEQNFERAWAIKQCF